MKQICILRRILICFYLFVSLQTSFGQEKKAALTTIVQEGHKSMPDNFSFSPDGKTFLSYDHDAHAAMLWSKQGQLIKLIPISSEYEPSIIFSPDGKNLVGKDAFYTLDGKKIFDYSLGANDGIACSKISPDGKLFALGLDNANLSNKRKIRIIDSNGNFVRLINGTNHTAFAIAWSPDGKMLALGAGSLKQQGYIVGQEEPLDPTCEVVIMTADGKVKDIITVEADVTDITFSKDGQRIVALLSNNKVKNWKLDKTLISEVKLESPLKHAEYAPDNKSFLVATYGLLYQYDAEGKLIRSFDASYENSCAFSPDGKYILTNDYKEIKLWESNGTLIKKIPSVTGNLFTDLKLSPTVNFFGSGQIVWSLGGKRILYTDPRLLDSLRTIIQKGNPKIISSDKKYYLTCNYKGVELYESLSSKMIQSFYSKDSAELKAKGFEVDFMGAFFSPDGKVLLKILSRSIQLFEVPSGKLMAEISTITPLNNGNEVNDVPYSYFGSRLTKCHKIFFSKDSQKLYILGMLQLKSYDLNGNKILSGPDIADHRISYDIIAVSKDETYLIGYYIDHHLIKISLADGSIQKVSTEVENPIDQMGLTAYGHFLITQDQNGIVKLWNSETLEEVVTFYAFGDTDYAIVTPDGYYAASRNAGKYMHFSNGTKTFTFDNFDLIYNRPDIIAKRMGYASAEYVTGLYNAYQKRLKKLGFTEDKVSLDVHLPEVEIVTKDLSPNTATKFLLTKIKVTDSKYLLDRINIYVNEVPLYGAKGMSLRELKTSDVTKDISIELTNGRNLIQFAVMNEKGAESIKESIDIIYTGPELKPVLYVVAIGVSDYVNNEFDLKYASKDASDLAALMVDNKSKFADVKVLKVLDLSATRDNIRNAKGFLKQSRVDDEVILFAAGHGLLDDKMDFYFATSNIDFNNPAEAGLPYEDLEGLLDGIPARQKLMLIDACNSGEVDKDETVLASTTKVSGGTVGSRGFKTIVRKESMGLKNSFELMQEMFADLRKGSGAIVISSASGVEFAFESDVWKNGVFTYSVLEGLKTNKVDKDKSNSVKVSELRDYVVERVGQLTNGKQHPTSRKENLEFDFNVW